MTHPASLIHLGVSYELNHLQQSGFQFSWNAIDRPALQFVVRVRYSTHCYSDKLRSEVPDGAAIVRDHADVNRIFCPRRHALSVELPKIIGEFGRKPTTSVSVAETGNYFVYRVTMVPTLRPGHKYYVFFSLRPVNRTPIRPDPYRLDLFVESAYERLVESTGKTDRKVIVRRNMPFGRIAEEVVRGKDKGGRSRP